MTKQAINIPLESKVPDFLVGELTAKLAYVDESIQHGRITGLGDSVELVMTKEVSTLQQKKITEKVLRLAQSLIKDAYQPKVIILEDYLDRKIAYDKDPSNELIKSGDIFQESKGIFTLGPLVSRLIGFFEKEFVDLAESFKAEPYRFPTLIPAEYLERVNYFHAFPHSLSFATHLREDLDVIQDFSQHAQCTAEGLNTSMESFSRIKTVLSPAVCYHLYFSLANQKLKEDHLIATAVGNCFRYESTNLNSLERLWNFTMREVIFIGSKEFVLEQREIGRSRMTEKFKLMGLAYKVESANDPFFIGEFKQAAFQNAFQLKFEIRASLPFKKSTLAVGSYNYHQDFFGRQLNILQKNGKPIHTGCIAFGLERIAYAFLSQYGIDTTKWPGFVRKAVE